MAIGLGKGHSRGGRPSMGGGGFRGASSGIRSAARSTSTGFRGTGGLGGLGGGSGFGGMATGTGFSSPSFNRPASPVGGFASSPINININKPKVHYGGGGGMVSSLLGSAVSAGVGVASAAIVNKIHENSQIKLQQQQAEHQAELQRQLAEQQAEYAAQQAEYQLELEKLKTEQEEIKRDVKQEKKYYANCPYCLGVNNGDKFCRYCGSSLAYYDDDEEPEDNNKRPNNNQ